MPRNIEIKAHISRIEEILQKVSTLTDFDPKEIVQEDIFFLCQNGRLKLRIFSESSGELIYYRRTDQSGPKESFYLRVPTKEPNQLRALLSIAYGETGRVKNRRTLLLVGRTRIHLDNVENLGHFLELEVVLEDTESIDSGTSEAKRIMDRLGIEQTQLVEGAYIDLLHKASTQNTNV